MIGDFSAVLNFNWLFIQTQPVHLLLAAGSPCSLDFIFLFFKIRKGMGILMVSYFHYQLDLYTM